IQDRVEGYVNGADIYMTKPASIKELDVVIQSLSRRLNFQTKPENVFLQGSSSKEKVEKLHAYITSTKGKLPNLHDLAKQFGISLRTLNDLFTAEYGQSISAFINDYRLSAAHEALEHSDIPMKQLASELGYSHVNHFITAFKRKFSYSPGHLRKT
ncbi:MAG: helix-turn-helix domain-containing protein, partial [Methylococcales bacterium]|nr:helix-turn-helix domain-containing protein [Methylococcales bacterium]